MQYFYKLIVVAVFILGCAGVTAAENSMPAAEQQFAQLPLPTQLWIKLEAKREAATNSISKESVIKAVHSAGNGLNLADMSIENTIYYVMMNIAKDAENDIHDAMTELEKVNKKKKDQRDELAKQKSERSVVAGTIKVGAIQNSTHPKIVRSAALDAILVSKQLNFDSLSSLSEDQQLKLQAALDHRAKAEETLSNTLKKTSNVQSSIIGNMK